MFDQALLPAAGLVVVLGFFAARHWKPRNAIVYFSVQLLSFVVLSALLFAAGVSPYRMAAESVHEPTRVYIGVLKSIWWLGAAWLIVGFSGAFVVLSREPREAKLLQDLIAGLVYVATCLAISSYVFDWPVQGLLATSGVVAVILGLALQNSLGDVFSAIVLNIERPYRVGDWIILDDSFQGQVIETNWRSTRVMTGNQDVAIVPNSLIARSKLVNCSVPTRLHGANLRIKLDPSCSPDVACQLMSDVLSSSTYALRDPPPSVTIQDISAECLDLQLSYSVSDVTAVGSAQNDVFERVFRAVSAAGFKFASRLAGRQNGIPPANLHGDRARRLLAGIPLFSTLTPEEVDSLAAEMHRKDFEKGQLVVRSGSVLQVLCIVANGVLVGTRVQDGSTLEIGRLAAGEYFGENGLLLNEPVNAEVTAFTRATLFEISRDALTQVLKRRPSISEELSESLARRRRAMQSFDQPHSEDRPVEGFADRLADRIRRLLSPQ